MALKPPSLQRDYTLVSWFDDALDLPVIPDLPDTAPAEDIAARNEIEKERHRLYDAACNTGDWQAIFKPGSQPTVFTFRQFPGAARQWLRGEIVRKNMIDPEIWTLAFRIALRGISNFGDWRPEPYDVEDGHSLVSNEKLERLYAVGNDYGKPMLGQQIIEQLGRVVFIRSIEGVRPL